MSTEMALNVIQQQLGSLLENDREARKSRAELRIGVDDLRVENVKINMRLDRLEQQMTAAQPTLNEYAVLKHKAAGAGMLGRWLWVCGAFLIGSAAAFVNFFETVKSWLMGN